MSASRPAGQVFRGNRQLRLFRQHRWSHRCLLRKEAAWSQLDGKESACVPACLLTICFLLCGNQQPGKAGAGGGGASAARRFGIICGQPDGPFQALAGAPARPHGPVENDLEMSQAPIPQQPALMIEGKKTLHIAVAHRSLKATAKNRWA